jgi:hypothetical protein
MTARCGESERAQLCAPSGHASVHAFQQSVIRFSRALLGEDDPGLALAVTGAAGQGAPYSKPGQGKAKVRCSLWTSGCTVSSGMCEGVAHFILLCSSVSLAMLLSRT